MQASDTQNPTPDTGDQTASDASTNAHAASADVTPSLEEAIRQAELKASEHHDAWLRAKAETENVRRRAQEDIAKASRYAVDKFAGELLAVRDSLEAALSSETPSIETMKEGCELTLKQLISAFEKNGLNDINPQGQKFDPHRHQAISMVESDAEPNTVISVLQKGYLLGDRVLRPALVVVARAKA
ncbi:nucleotide exchange factor GrpE [Rhodocyclus tenuis]|uniref:Protein GrpE n=2 Tax=Rhodocyclus TaxID=1064 RepID=A0A6L5JVV2_RHOTE|nr:nucleotide exchange factor GrpE [Rhodocyclus gracilis]MQY51186.1 nucleotide exchange factor GrpE [Rhodocyclus gracilis]MRD71928.1 nucleotide exchange factor GrpE [Rhodocyclus gracilis]NJA88895.1 nucleotide exchange factor GrpE [Rhodocyclus gracilis]